MSAKYMRTPVGPMRIREEIRVRFAGMTDREIADQAIDNGTPFVDPEFYAELCHRGLSGPGWFKADTYREIEKREAQA